MSVPPATFLSAGGRLAPIARRHVARSAWPQWAVGVNSAGTETPTAAHAAQAARAAELGAANHARLGHHDQALLGRFPCFLLLIDRARPSNSPRSTADHGGGEARAEGLAAKASGMGGRATGQCAVQLGGRESTTATTALSGAGTASASRWAVCRAAACSQSFTRAPSSIKLRVTLEELHKPIILYSTSLETRYNGCRGVVWFLLRSVFGFWSTRVARFL